MNIFLNEHSFQGQFHDIEHFQLAVVRFLKLVNSARGAVKRTGGRMLRSENLGNAHAIRNQTLHKSLNHIKCRELMLGFTDVVYNKANPAPWEPERVHGTGCTYVLVLETRMVCDSAAALGNGTEVSNTSVAELAERLLSKTSPSGCLLNIEKSSIDSLNTISVLKNNLVPVALRSISDDVAFKTWLDRDVGVVPLYSESDTEPPRDEQTCLTDDTVYRPTERECQGRKIYRHITSLQYYYVDNLHNGAAAHLEVFDKFGRKHKGKALLNGQICPNTQDPSKKALNL